MMRPEMNQSTARALTEAGYMTVSEYLRLCRESGPPSPDI